MTSPDEPRFFASPEALRAWFESNAAAERELLVGFRKVATGARGMGYQQALDEALSFGWIDGVRRSLGSDAYTIRFSPRKRGSNWSLVNIQRAKELIAEGRMRPPGLAAFAARDEEKAHRYSYEAVSAGFPEPYEARLRADEAAWAYFASRPPSYRRTATHWVMSAKREETRERRLATLIADSAASRPIAASLPRRLRPGEPSA